MEKSNSNLRGARNTKNDEFYTCADDIEKELKNYESFFEGKTVYCNFDDSEKSEFWKYFVGNFEKLKLRRVISTHIVQKGNSVCVEYDGIKITSRPLSGNGDFQSEECLDILRSCDVVVTNPAWSLFRKLIKLLFEYDKQFLLLGNKNALTYKEIVALFQQNKIRLGVNAPNKFMTPEGKSYKVSGLSKWFTNINISKNHKELKMTKRYYEDNGINRRKETIDLYPRVVNYEAINIDNVSDIPLDYFGKMAVPVSYLDKHNPENFRIIGTSYDLAEPMEDFVEDETAYVKGGPAFYISEGESGYRRLYYRIVIQRR